MCVLGTKISKLVHENIWENNSFIKLGFTQRVPEISFHEFCVMLRFGMNESILEPDRIVLFVKLRHYGDTAGDMVN